MNFNLNAFQPQNIKDNKYKFAVIGAGAAGITIANKLSSAGNSVALVEAGDYEISEESQNIYQGKVVGDPYFDLDVARLRLFGGSTNHWGGMCRSFEEIDFQRGYLGEEYQWPITKFDIDNYYEEALNILEIHPVESDINLNDSSLREIYFKFSPPVNFRNKYFNELDTRKNIHIFLNANLKDISVDAGKISAAYFESFTGNRISIIASTYIFCMGGIENSRYLKYFKDKYSKNFFFDNLPVGKYWMEHPHANLGKIIIKKNKNIERYFALQDSFQKKFSILNCGLKVDNFYYNSETKALIREIACLSPNLGKKLFSTFNKNLICSGSFQAAWEQAPKIENKISLDTEVDKFNVPRPILYWKKFSLDTETLKHTVNEFNKWLLYTDTGRIRLDDWVFDDYNYPSSSKGGAHHMGGTRMHKNPKFGVVDSNCKVFGTKNLYIAGSSIFTTSGHNNPTLPIIQFALRLSDHLSNKKIHEKIL